MAYCYKYEIKYNYTFADMGGKRTGQGGSEVILNKVATISEVEALFLNQKFEDITIENITEIKFIRKDIFIEV